METEVEENSKGVFVLAQTWMRRPNGSALNHLHSNCNSNSIIITAKLPATLFPPGTGPKITTGPLDQPWAVPLADLAAGGDNP